MSGIVDEVNKTFLGQLVDQYLHVLSGYGSLACHLRHREVSNFVQASQNAAQPAGHFSLVMHFVSDDPQSVEERRSLVD